MNRNLEAYSRRRPKSYGFSLLLGGSLVGVLSVRVRDSVPWWVAFPMMVFAVAIGGCGLLFLCFGTKFLDFDARWYEQLDLNDVKLRPFLIAMAGGAFLLGGSAVLLYWRELWLFLS